MVQPVAYLNGRWLPESEAVVSIHDLGFLVGATVTERLRTFHGRLFRLDRHLERLEHSLNIVGIPLGMPLEQLGQAADELAQRNHALVDPGDDLGLSLFVTPGIVGTVNQPTIGMHTVPLPFEQWAGEYERGAALIVPTVRQMPPECLPPELKCRSRMHFYLADREAAARQAGARALMLDRDDFVTETTTANLVMYRSGEGIASPPIEKVLPGTSLAVLQELAEQFGIAWTHRDITLDELRQADEAMLTSTSPCLLPVSEVDRSPIGDGKPGPLFRRLLRAWSDLVELDIAAQAKRFARRPAGH